MRAVRVALGTVAALSVSLLSAPTQADLVVYPAKGQSAQQQSKDEGECQTWAKGNTGVDPVAVANASGQAPATPPPQQGGQRVRGAARGAAAGAAVGAVAGDAGKGAAVGAATGTVVAGSRKRRGEAAANQQAQAQNQQAASDRQAQMATFNKAYSACLEGRGYSVK
jgi:OmpA family protein